MGSRRLDKFSLQFPAFRVAVAAGSRSAAVLRELYEEVLSPAEPTVPGLSIRIDDEADGTSTMRGLRGVPRSGLSATGLMDQVVGELNRLAVDEAGDQLSLHGAVLEMSGKALIVLGDSGTGKSTAALALMQRGWRYMSDEVAWVAPGAQRLTALHKPLTVKPGTLSLVGVPCGSEAEPPRAYLPAASFGKTTHGSVEPRAIAVLGRNNDPGSAPLRLSAAEATVEIVRNAFDVDRLGGRSGLLRAAQLAERCVVSRIATLNLDERIEALENLWRELPVRSTARALPTVAARPGVGLRWAPDVHGVLVGESAVLRSDRTKLLTLIDPLPRGLWGALDGTRNLPDVVSAVAREYGGQPDLVGNDLRTLIESLQADGVVFSHSE